MKIIGDIGRAEGAQAINELIRTFNFLDYFKIPGPTLADIKGRRRIFEKIREANMGFAISIYSEECIEIAKELNPDLIKIPSCRMAHISLHKKVRAAFPGIILHVSNGMSLPEDRGKLVASSNSIVRYACTYNPGEVVIDPRLPGVSCRVPEPFFGQAAAMFGIQFLEYKIAMQKDDLHIDRDGLKEVVRWVEKNQDTIKNIQKTRPADISQKERDERTRTGWASTPI